MKPKIVTSRTAIHIVMMMMMMMMMIITIISMENNNETGDYDVINSNTFKHDLC